MAALLFLAAGRGTEVAIGQTDDWVRVDRPLYSFDYPATWVADEHVTEQGSLVSVVEPGQQHAILVGFQNGFKNRPGILNQCASVDEYLDSYYQAQFAPLATGTGQYPYTTVTHDDFQPGWLGGKSTTVSMVHVEAYQPPMTRLTWMNAVPRPDGIYIVVYTHPSEPMEISEGFRLRFLKSVVLKSKAYDPKAYCNYLGK